MNKFSLRPIAARLSDHVNNKLRVFPMEWCSHLTIALKPGGKIRICLNLTNSSKCVRTNKVLLIKYTQAWLGHPC